MHRSHGETMSAINKPSVIMPAAALYAEYDLSFIASAYFWPVPNMVALAQYPLAIINMAVAISASMYIINSNPCQRNA